MTRTTTKSFSLITSSQKLPFFAVQSPQIFQDQTKMATMSTVFPDYLSVFYDYGYIYKLSAKKDLLQILNNESTHIKEIMFRVEVLNISFDLLFFFLYLFVLLLLTFLLLCCSFQCN